MNLTSRELIRKTLAHEPVPRLPRDLWTVPYINFFRNDELMRMRDEYPADVGHPSAFRYGASPYAKGAAYRKGGYTDEFGAHWTVAEDGVTGEVKEPIIQTMDDLNKYRLPWELLDGAADSGQAEAYRNTDKFVIGGTYVRPFERMQFLHGSEELFVDIALESPVFLELRERLHAFNLRDIKLMSAQAVDAVSFMDDWGSQRALLISPAAWRKFFKPMYKEYCDIIRAAGKRVFFHTDGHIEAIYPDLVEIGVDAVNSQLFCMDMEMLGREYGGRITFWGELDRQHILPDGSEDEVRQSVRRVMDAVKPRTHAGLIAQMSWETRTPYRNVAAAYDEFERYFIN